MNIRRALFAVGITAALVLVTASAAAAHADLVASDPASGTTLVSPPAEIRLTFSEAPDPSLSAVELLNQGGATVPIGSPAMDGARTLVVAVPGTLADGVYTVSWRAVSADDGHVTSGAFPFGIGASPGTGPTASTTDAASGPTPLSVVSKSLLYAGLMVLVAAAVVGVGLFGGAPSARRRVALWAGLAAASGAIGFLVAQQRAIGVSLQVFVRSEAGRDPVGLVVASVVALALAAAGGRSDRRWLPWAAGVMAAIALGIRARGGHAASAPMPALAEFLQWGHMLAAACWVGGLLLLVLLLRERTVDSPVTASKRYSAMATVAIAVVVLSGLLRAVSELGGWGGLSSALSTSYGTTLAVKVAVVLLIVGLGAWNRFRGIHRLERDARPLRRVAAAELVGFAGVLALTATLTGLAPPQSATTATPSGVQAVTMTGSDFATTVTAGVTVTPGLPGSNAFRVTLTAYGTDQPFAADAVSLQMRSVTKPDLAAAQIELRPDAGAWTERALDPSIAGTYAVNLQIRSGSAVTEVPLVLITRSAGSITTSPSPGGDTVTMGSFPDGVRVNASSSPGATTQIHLTAFAPNGTELPVGSVALVATPAVGAPQRLHVERFSAGHFAANASLAAAMWTFDAVLSTRAGATYQVTWQATAGG